MTVSVRQLIERLQALKDLDSTVIVSKDGEGNRYSPLATEDLEGCLGYYIPESTWSGEMRFDSQEEGDEPDESAVRAVCLFPIN